MVSNGVTEEPISSELVLVDQALGRRARAALPDPPWLVPALAELRERPRANRAEAPVAERPARPSHRPRRPAAGSVVLVVIGLAFATVAALAFVPQSNGPSIVTGHVEQAAPAAPLRPPRPKPAAEPRSTRAQRATTPTKRQGRPPLAKTRTKRQASPPARKPRPKPSPRALTRAQRVVTWRRFPPAVYYAVYLQRGAKTLFHTRTARPGTVLPARLRLRPGTYRVVVRPAIPNEAGIVLGPAIVRRTVTL